MPSIIAIANAGAYAHTEGIVHRDLTPSNVMLGEYGETIVEPASDVVGATETQNARLAASSDRNWLAY